MKRINKRNFLYMVIVFILLIACMFTYKWILVSNNNYTLIEYDQMIEKINNDDSFFLIISREECTYCKTLKNEITNMKRNSPEILIYEYKKTASNDIVPKLNEILPEFKLVPYICYVKNGEINKYNGKLDIKKIYNWIDSIE